jgi:acyl-CoA thioesterase-2
MEMPKTIEDALPDLIAHLELEKTGENQFRGQPQDVGNGRLFGGLVFSQAMRAALATTDGRPAHSAHAYFLRPGNPHRPIEYEVDRIRDGRSFKTRRVVAHQGADAIFNLALSCHENEAGPSHQMDVEIPAEPRGETHEEAIRSGMRGLGIEMRPGDFGFGAFEMRIEGGLEMVAGPPREPQMRSWIRARGIAPRGPHWSAPLLAFASDFSIMSPAFHPLEYGPMTAGVQTASLDHSMWFHAPFEMDDWLYAVHDSPVLTGGRGIGRALYYRRDGRLVASAVQEALFRPPR